MRVIENEFWRSLTLVFAAFCFGAVLTAKEAKDIVCDEAKDKGFVLYHCKK